MTIYHINPVTGSNANSGLTWPQAWRQLPGNGTAILAGDEVRYAKSATYTTIVSYLATMAPQTSPNPTGSYFVAYGTWVGTAPYATNDNYGLRLTASTTIPANTKLGYLTVAHTSTTNRAIIIPALMRYMPAKAKGAGLRVAVCSDTAGNTPIFWLDSAHFYTDADHRIIYTYSSATPISISMGSLAVYSGSESMVTPAAVATFINFAYYCLITLEEAKNVLPQYGTAFKYTATSASPYYATAPIVRSVHKTISTSYSGSSIYCTLGATPAPTLQEAATSTLFCYEPCPCDYGDELTLSATAHTFTGTLANPIKLRGGFDPGTGLQDGYTNLDLAVSVINQYGVLNFALNCGDYLEFENILCLTRPLVSYKAATAAQYTLNSIKVTRCLVGGDSYGARGYPVISTTATNNNFRLLSFTATESIVSSLWVLVGRGGTENLQVWGAGGLTYGTVTFTDSISGPGFRSNTTTGTSCGIVVLNEIAIVGTSAYKAALVTLEYGNEDQIYFNTVLNDFTIRVENAVIATSTSTAQLACAWLPPGVTYGRIVFRNVTARGTPNYASFIFYGFKHITFDGIKNDRAMIGPYLSAKMYANTTWWANNPTASVTITGELGTTNASALSGPTISVKYARNLSLAGLTALDNGMKAPTLGFTQCTPQTPLVVENMRLSYVVFDYYPNDTATLAAQFTSAVPDAYVFEVRNCHCTVASSYPAGWVRVVGCTLYGSSTPPTWQGSYGANGENTPVRYAVSGPVIGLGCTLVGGRLGNDSVSSGTTELLNSGSLYSGRRIGVLSGLSGDAYIPIPLGSQYGTNMVYGRPASLYTVEEGTSRSYPLFARNAKGWISRVGGTGRATLSTATTNAYGAYDVTVLSGMFLGRVALEAGKNMAVSVVVRSTAVGIFRLTVGPSRAYSSVLSGHVLYRSVRTLNTDITYILNIAPSGDGSADVYVYCSVPMVIRHFTVTSS